MRTATLSTGALAALAFLAGCTGTERSAPAPDYAAKSAVLAASFQQALQDELKAALETVGPAAAIGVCQQAAPAIAQRMSEESGADVRRLALRNRNPDGEATGEFAEKMRQLAKAPLGPDGKPAIVQWESGEGADRMVHVLSAIPMKDKPCATCHGTDIAPDVQERLDALYPNDKATGFVPGELRGAFAISWPTPQR